jgi:hypothetical protein
MNHNHHTSATNAVTLAVLPIALPVTGNNTNRAYGVPNPAFTGTIGRKMAW